MKYWVYYRYGGCNDGSCSYGLQPFDTLVLAEAFISSIMREHGTDDPSCTILQGAFIKDVEWGTCAKPWLK